MRSKTTRRFRAAFEDLPDEVRQQAREAYQLFKKDPFQRSLRFKRVHPAQPIYSVRVGRDYRAVGIRRDDEIIWYWIGSHSDYDKLLSRR